MFTVKTRLRESPIDGCGVFAEEDIPKGTVVWRFNPLLDVVLDPKALEALTEVELSFLRKYTYLNQKIGKYVLAIDDSRFMNHSDDPNLVGIYSDDSPELLDVAARDIRRGEELTSDYRTFDGEAEIKLSVTFPLSNTVVQAPPPETVMQTG